MINQNQRQAFEETGLLRIEALIPLSLIEPAREMVLEGLKEAGYHDGDIWTCSHPLDWKTGNDLAKALKKRVRRTDTFTALATPETETIAKALGHNDTLKAHLKTPQLLFTPPGHAPWTVPHNIWHLDLPRLQPPGNYGVQFFAFLDKVRPQGAGTLVVSGSHKLLNDKGYLSSASVKKLLKREPYFSALFNKKHGDRGRFLNNEEYVEGTALKVVELTGEPGDVFFMDMRLLHTLAPNAQANPRIMVTHRYLAEPPA